MRLTDGSICASCDLFEHECGIPDGDDVYCKEHCESKNKLIVEKFFEDDNPIEECKDFE